MKMMVMMMMMMMKMMIKRRSRWYNSEEEIMHCRTYNWAAFQRSIAALYERRRMAQQYGCFAEVGLYYLPVREEAT